MSPPSELPHAVQASWRSFLTTYEPLRPDLYRYCRHLTRSPWDAEDLAQDTLARAFVMLGQLGSEPPTPRAWLFRVASNLWIDRMRRRREEPLEGEPETRGLGGGDPRSAREAVGTLLGQLSPQERAAVVLKDVFELSLEETADTLATTIGAIKAALHRARGKLAESPSEPVSPPAPQLLDAFCRAFNARDLDRLASLLLEHASVEVVGATTLYGRKRARDVVLNGMLFGVQRMASAYGSDWVAGPFMEGVLPTPPRIEARAHRGGWVLLHWYAHRDGDAVRALTRIHGADDHVSHLQNYFYTPDLIADVCAELGVPARSNGYRW